MGQQQQQQQQDLVFCGPPKGTIAVAGSALVTPIASAWAVAYQKACRHNHVNVTVDGRERDGAERLCGAAGGAPVDIAAMTRYVSRERTSWCLDEHPFS
jgi:ABC-type phosphate transport system substrate-binding protein